MEYPFKDLMPLEEVLEREGYYKDWTHLDPKTFYSIVQISEMIKTKGFGTDVRLLISQLAEHFGLSVAEVVRISNGLIASQAAVENRQDALEIQTAQSVAQMEADKNTIVANATVDSEVILARGGKPTLQARLDETTAQLADIAINVKTFGAKGDGVTDDVDAIQSAIAAIPKTGGTLIFPPGTYLHGDGTNPHYDLTAEGAYVTGQDIYIGKDNRYYFTDYKNLRIEGLGAKIVSHPNNSNIVHNAMFIFDGCENVTVSNIVLDGRIGERQPTGKDPSQFNRQAGIRVDNNCKNVVFNNVESSYSLMDGFTITGGSKEIELNNCIALYNYRQGVSIGNADDTHINGGEFSYTGKLYGTLPMAGIDVESNHKDTQTNDRTKISGCVFKDNTGRGVEHHFGTRNSIIEYCEFFNNDVLGINDLSVHNNTYRYNKFYNSALRLNDPGFHAHNNFFSIDKQNQLALTFWDGDDLFLDSSFRKPVAEKNEVRVSLPSGATGSYGHLVFLAKRLEYNDNYHVNIFSDADAVLIDYRSSNIEMNGNEFEFNDNRYTNTGLINRRTSIKSFDNNAISKTYTGDLVNYIKNDGLITDGLFIKNQQIVMNTGEYIDVFFTKDYGSVKISAGDSYRSRLIDGFREEMFYTGGRREMITTTALHANNGVKLSDVYLKNDKSCITVYAQESYTGYLKVQVENRGRTIDTDTTFEISSPYTNGTVECVNIYSQNLYLKGWSRPSAMGFDSVEVGACFFLQTGSGGIPIWWTGTEWKNAAGTVV